MLAELQHIAWQYNGVDWVISLLVFIGLFCIGEHRRKGFLIGAASAAFGIIFSMQIKSVANGVTSAVLLILYLRGYAKFSEEKALPATQTIEAEQGMLANAA